MWAKKINLIIFLASTVLTTMIEASVSQTCADAIRTCESQALAQPKCRSTWWSVQMSISEADNNNDCVFSWSDLQTDLSVNYDTDGDKQICSEEWLAVRSNRLGFSEEFSQWQWKNLTEETCVALDDWRLEYYFSPGSVYNDTVLDVNTILREEAVTQLVAFCLEGSRLSSNPDCLGLAEVCKGQMSGLSACQSLGTQMRSLYDIITFIERLYDVDGDGIITADEMLSLLNDDIDIDGNECINQTEWTSYLEGRAHFSTELARAEFEFLGGSKESCIALEVVANVYDDGASTFVASLLERIVSVCQAAPEFYDQVHECVQLAVTCTTYFPYLDVCTIFGQECGPGSLQQCVEGVTTGQCSDNTDDLRAVAETKSRSLNHFNSVCIPSPFSLTDDPVSSVCRAAINNCSQQALVADTCSTTWNSFLLQTIRSDVTNDCMIDVPDIAFDLRNGYDTNGDGKVCEEEWQERRGLYFGLSASFVTWQWNQIKKDGQCIEIESFYSALNPIVTSTFTDALIEQLSAFCLLETNMDQERDCYSLAYICREKSSNMSACKNFDVSLMTLAESISTEALMADENGDGIIMETEMDNLLKSSFDTDQDGCVSPEEWSTRWTSTYQFSEAFGQYYYTQVVSTCLKTSDLKIPVEGIDVTSRAYTLLETVVKMCEDEPTLYQALPECSQLYDTCSKHFSGTSACQPLLDRCGISSYVTCLASLEWSECKSATDRWDVQAETARVWNQNNDKCTAQPILANLNLASNGHRPTRLGLLHLLSSLMPVLVTLLCCFYRQH